MCIVNMIHMNINNNKQQQTSDKIEYKMQLQNAITKCNYKRGGENKKCCEKTTPQNSM